jgi:PhzF family phenazine biosynthesis protein
VVYLVQTKERILANMQFYQVDVFSQTVLGGNALAIVLAEGNLEDTLMLKIAQEFKQFETVFLFLNEHDCFPLRIFTVQEELPFAGHPLLGTAALIHRLYYPGEKEVSLCLKLGNRLVQADSKDEGDWHSVILDQGKPQFLNTVEDKDKDELCASLNVSREDLSPLYPVEVVSTGIPYLLVPLQGGLSKLKITNPDFEAFLARFDAKFSYVFDSETLECRSFDNSGIYEDSATGSAAGPLIAYLVRHGFKQRGKPVLIRQGSFVLRPSIIRGWVEEGESGKVFIQGDVTLFASGTMQIPV